MGHYLGYACKVFLMFRNYQRVYNNGSVIFKGGRVFLLFEKFHFQFYTIGLCLMVITVL